MLRTCFSERIRSRSSISPTALRSAYAAFFGLLTTGAIRCGMPS